MNQRVLITSALLGAAALGTALTLHIERTQAQPLPLDECITVGNASPATRLCLHQFSDHSKCVVAVTRGTETATTDLSCKII
jgi:hypothetical protein